MNARTICFSHPIHLMRWTLAIEHTEKRTKSKNNRINLGEIQNLFLSFYEKHRQFSHNSPATKSDVYRQRTRAEQTKFKKQSRKSEILQCVCVWVRVCASVLPYTTCRKLGKQHIILHTSIGGLRSRRICVYILYIHIYVCLYV